MVIEKTTPATVIIELAMVESSERAPSAPPDHTKPREFANLTLAPVRSKLTVAMESRKAARAINKGTNQKLECTSSQTLCNRSVIEVLRANGQETACPISGYMFYSPEILCV